MVPNPFPISVDKITSFLVACVFFPAGVIKGLSPGCNVYSLSELYLLYLRLHHTLIWNHTQGKFTLDIVLCFLKACSDSICRPLHFPFLRQIALCFLSPSSIPQSLTCFLPLSPPLIQRVNHSESFNIYATLVLLSSSFMRDCIFDKITDPL